MTAATAGGVSGPPSGSAAAPPTPPGQQAGASAEEERKRGNAALQQGDAASALRHYERFAQLRPAHAPAHLNRGFALMQLGRLDEAEAALREADRLAPDNAEQLHFLAQCLVQRGRSNEAEALHQRVVTLQPTFEHSWVALALLQEARGAHEAAAASFAKAVQANPGAAFAWQGRARVGLLLRCGGDALEGAQRWLALESGNPQALGMQADALRLLDRHAEALTVAEAALALAPGEPRLRLARAMALLGNARFEEASRHLEELAASAAHDTAPEQEVLPALGAALLGQERNDEAEHVLRRAAALKPGDPDIAHDLALADMNRRRYSEAAAGLEQAVQRHPHNARLGLAAAVAQLTQGHWAEGWQRYEARLSAEQAQHPKAWRPGQPIEGRRLLVCAEQGLGDAIHFARYLPVLVQRKASVVCLVPAALHAVLAPLTQGCTLITAESEAGDYDLRCSLLSLPHLLGLAEPLPMQAPYAALDGARRSHWPRWLSGAASAGAGPTALRVGLAWAGNPKHPDDRRRSMPLQTVRLALQELADVQFVSLQWDIKPSDEAARAAWPALLHPGREQRDMADTAALIDALDVVVAVDTSLAHLAGAMQKKALLLLPFNADWRWGVGRDDTPWYPSIRLVRQPRPGAWPEALEMAVAALQSTELRAAAAAARRAVSNEAAQRAR